MCSGTRSTAYSSSEGSDADGRVIYANATLAAMMRRAEGWPVGRTLNELEQEWRRTLHA
jgi:hypothetical protein